MPASIKLQQQYGDDVQVIFVESQRHSREEYEAFAWRAKWMGTNAMWTEEPPVQPTGTGLPECALIGVDGKILLQGNPLALKKQIDETVAAQVKLTKDAPVGAAADVKKAWAAFAKGDLAGALAQCDKAATDEAKKAKDEFLARVRGRIGRAKWMIDNSYLSEAGKLLGALEKLAKADAALSKEVADQSARLHDPAVAKEVEAGAALANLTEKMAGGKPFEDATVKKLSAIADKYKGTKAAERAAHLASLAKVKA